MKFKMIMLAAVATLGMASSTLALDLMPVPTGNGGIIFLPY